MYDDAVKRPTAVSQSGVEPGILLFLGNDAANLLWSDAGPGSSDLVQVCDRCLRHFPDPVGHRFQLAFPGNSLISTASRSTLTMGK